MLLCSCGLILTVGLGSRGRERDRVLHVARQASESTVVVAKASVDVQLVLGVSRSCQRICRVGQRHRLTRDSLLQSYLILLREGRNILQTHNRFHTFTIIHY